MNAARPDLVSVFERAPGLAQRVAARIGADAAANEIIAAARAELACMSEAERIAVLDAHPRIGADPATLSATSRREQAAGDDPATLRDLATLNEEYERRFGFRFVVWVNGRSKSALIRVLRSRLRYDRERELATGIAEFLAIAADRLRSR